MFYKRLEKAIKQDLKTDSEIIEYCKKEANKNYSDNKVHDLQCICEYLQYKLKNGNISFDDYAILQFNLTFGIKKEA